MTTTLCHCGTAGLPAVHLDHGHPHDEEGNHDLHT